MSDATKSACWPMSLPVLHEDMHLQEARTVVAVLHLHNRLERQLAETLDPHGLTLSQFDVLATLRDNEGINQQELASWLLVTKGNVCGLIDRASAAGWVERRPDPDDRRVNRLSLTARGRQLVDQARPGLIALGRKFFGPLSETDIRLLCELLERVVAANSG